MNIEQEKYAIKTLQTFEPETEPYYLCNSGGKMDVYRWWMGEEPDQITFEDIYDDIGVDLTID